ncbi:branched-chain amino acid transaminase [Alteribacillus iranensis]|uniref:Branched-chain-amino-acid aminotransferase n=1 Tax=Alteribacillus iranensis TaxID=930128 RepID=A0A1I2B934_9BACI|nr:branched-chain amino acid transaminase [Alteribacillus iranensis]SFE51823.1 branched chain amino acid aminotransferase apoenzyme [Alteribacillus iranensis]
MEKVKKWFPDVEKIWFNGKLVKWEEANIHVLSHGVAYGSGVFEGLRCYNTIYGPRTFRVKEHIERWRDSAKQLRMTIPYSDEELIEAINNTIIENDLEACYIRPLAFFGYHSLGVDPLDCPVDVVIATWPWEDYLGSAAKSKGVRCCFSPWIRVHSQMVPSAAKATGLYIGSMLARVDAKDKGFDEAIMLDGVGNVAEACTENIFVVKDGVIATPGLDSSILPGITRKSIIELAKELGYTVEIRSIARGEIYSANEVFLTGSAAEIKPVREVDARKIGSGEPGPITKHLISEFSNIVRGKNSKYLKWLDSVINVKPVT